MLRIKLFGLFIAFAGLALVRPRKCLELLEAADAGAKKVADEIDYSLKPGDIVYSQNWGNGETPIEIIDLNWALRAASVNIGVRSRYVVVTWRIASLRREPFGKKLCSLPPAGWRCARRAGHDGPCAVVK